MKIIISENQYNLLTEMEDDLISYESNFESGPAVYYGKEIKLKDLEKQGYSIPPSSLPPKYGLKDINFEVYATTKSAAEMNLMKKLSDAKIPSDRNSGMIFSKPDGQGVRVKWIQFVK